MNPRCPTRLMSKIEGKAEDWLAPCAIIEKKIQYESAWILSQDDNEIRCNYYFLFLIVTFVLQTPLSKNKNELLYVKSLLTWQKPHCLEISLPLNMQYKLLLIFKLTQYWIEIKDTELYWYRMWPKSIRAEKAN